jgi:hypothetical protein
MKDRKYNQYKFFFTQNIDLNNCLDHTVSVQSLVEEYFTDLKRSYFCDECGSKMKEMNIPTKLPSLLFINFNGEKFKLEAEREFNVFNTLYELVYMVYWGGSHFITRMNTPLGQYEYDGVKNDGLFKRMDTSNFFCGIIGDTRESRKIAVGATYRKK